MTPLLSLVATTLFVVVAVLALLDWRRRRTGAAAAIAAALALLAVVRLTGAVGSYVDVPGSPVITLFALAGSGLAIFEHRARLFDLAAGWRVAVAGALAVPVAVLLVVGLPADDQTALGTVQTAAVIALVLVWVGCLVEPATTLWRSSVTVAAVQRAQLRLLAGAYLAMALVLLSTMLVTVGGAVPAGITVVTQAAAGLIAVTLYLSIKPPAALRRAWLRRRAHDLAQQLHPLATWHIDLVTGTTWMSSTFRELLGLPERASLSLDGLLDLLHPDDRPEAERVLERLIEDHEPVEHEYRVQRASDGELRWIRATAHVLLDLEHSQPTALFGTLQDVTRDRLIEQHLQQALAQEQEAAERLRRIDELKSAFLSAVSHELRTPLTALKGFGLTMQVRGDDLEITDRRLLSDRIVQNAERLDRLLADLLDLDRLDGGDGGLRLERIDVTGLIGAAIEELDVGRRRIHLDVPADGVIAVVDAVKIERVVANLLRNAVDHTPPTSTIWVRMRSPDTQVEIIVEDDGPGIPDPLKTEVFERFRQGGPSPTRGTGIGLALVRQFTELHGGRVWVADRQGGGASFHLVLPAHPGAAAEIAG